jgi:lysophospholipid acyltransferase (LPLAT)-like uncharacterized protein
MLDTAMSKPKKRNPLKNNLLLKKALSDLAGQPMRLIRKSWQVDSIHAHPRADGLLKAGTPVIYALWHGRMYCLFKAVPLDKVAILVSPSNDGEFITRIAQRIGFHHFVRGSHKRGGTQAILGLRKALLDDRLSIAFTVDGPRGPRYQVKPGIIRLASQTGVPIIPLGSASRWLLKKFDRSWDHFHAPLPFTGIHLEYGEPLQVPPGLDEEEIRQYCQKLEEELLNINLQADSVYGFKNRERL